MAQKKRAAVAQDPYTRKLEARVAALEKRLEKVLSGEVDLEIRRLSVGPKSVIRVQCE